METLTRRVAASTYKALGTALDVTADMYVNTPSVTSDSMDLEAAMKHLREARKLLRKVARMAPVVPVKKAA